METTVLGWLESTQLWSRLSYLSTLTSSKLLSHLSHPSKSLNLNLFMQDVSISEPFHSLIQPPFSRAEIADLDNFERYTKGFLVFVPQNRVEFDLLPLMKRLVSCKCSILARFTEPRSVPRKLDGVSIWPVDRVASTKRKARDGWVHARLRSLTPWSIFTFLSWSA